MSQPLDPALPRDLAGAAAHPLDPSAVAGVETVQTHLSWVFLTGTRVYKLRKAVDLGFVDFTTRAERNADCLREVGLNRRLAPDVYLGVAPLRRGGTGFEVGPVAEALASGAPEPPEHCVVMRRLPGGRDALALLRAGRLRPEQLDLVAGVLAVFHADQRLERPAPWSAPAWRARIEDPVRECLEALRAASALAADRIAAVETHERARFAACRERFEARRLAGRAVDGHGDVHLEHVWFERDESAPLLVDCVEFRDDLRRIDAASDVAFLAMDLAYRERADLAERFLRHYARETDDFDLYAVVDYFAGYRALVRAKVAALAAGDPGIGREQRAAAASSAERHTALASRLLESGEAGRMFALCGTVGTGKSSVAEALADVLPGVVVSSDRTRKHLAGLPPLARAEAAPGAGLYTPGRTEQVYRGLLERAAPVLASGRAAILDATFARREQRARVLAWARERDCDVTLVEVRCEPARVRDRLARRRAGGRDPSDAGPELLARSLRDFEPPDEWPADRRRVVRTDRPGWRETLAGLAG